MGMGEENIICFCLSPGGVWKEDVHISIYRPEKVHNSVTTLFDTIAVNIHKVHVVTYTRDAETYD